ncbi:MAG: hypothetical protein AAF721_16730 [Myxococcota bacterium]
MFGMGRGLAILLLTLGSGCQNDAVTLEPEDPADAPTFEERCGDAAPVELLALHPQQYAFEMDWAPGGERLLVGVFQAAGPLGLFPSTQDRAIVSVGPCGEDPVVVGEAMEVASPYDDIALACSVDGDALYRIDPTGAQPPVKILDGTCAVRHTDLGLVAVLPTEGRVGRLVIIRQPEVLAPAVETLVDGVGLPDSVFFGGDDHRTTPLWASGREALAMRPSGEVIAVDLEDGTTSVEVDAAIEFRASSDGTKFVWQSAEGIEGDAETPISPIFLHDRASSSGVHLLNSHLAWTAAPFRRKWTVVRDNSVLGQRIFDDAGVELVLPEGTTLRGIISDEQFWLVRKEGDTTEELVWDVGSEPRVVIDHVAGQAAKHGDGFAVFEDDGQGPALEGTLRYGAFEGGVDVLSERINFDYRILGDGRLLSILDEDNNAHGRLLLQDPEAQRQVELAEHGYLHSPALNKGDPFDGDVVWAVDDRETEEHALYRAAVAR